MSLSVDESSISGTVSQLGVNEIDLDGIVDEDVQQLGKNLHTSLNDILSTSIDYMQGVKTRMVTEKEDALRERDQFYLAQLARQQEIIDGLSEKLAQTELKLENEVDRLEAISENAADMWNRKHRIFSGDTALGKAYTQWKDIAFENKRSSQLEHVARGLYEKGLKSKAFSTFVRLFARNAIDREKKKAVAEHEKTTRTIIEKYEITLARMRTENAEAHQVAQLEQLRRQQLEEDLRRTFLKNMTTMNMEALQLFSHTKPQEVQTGPPMTPQVMADLGDESPRARPPPTPEAK